MMDIGSISRFVLSHNRLVVAAWLVTFAARVILDATIVRALLVPALVSLMGHWNWWLPSWLGWLAPTPKPITGDQTETTAPHVSNSRSVDPALVAG